MSTSFSAGSGENVNDSASNLNPMSLDRKHSRWKRLARKGTVSPGGMALQPSSVMNLVLGSVRPHVTPSINGFLDAKFSGEEIRQALFQTVCQLFFSKNTGTLLVRSGCGVLRMSE
ncbi:hypothetical protein ACOSP7_021028 [Xanthoceras sorbifolium]